MGSAREGNYSVVPNYQLSAPMRYSLTIAPCHLSCQYMSLARMAIAHTCPGKFWNPTPLYLSWSPILPPSTDTNHRHHQRLDFVQGDDLIWLKMATNSVEGDDSVISRWIGGRETRCSRRRCLLNESPFLGLIEPLMEQTRQLHFLMYRVSHELFGHKLDLPCNEMPEVYI